MALQLEDVVVGRAKLVVGTVVLAVLTGSLTAAFAGGAKPPSAVPRTVGHDRVPEPTCAYPASDGLTGYEYKADMSEDFAAERALSGEWWVINGDRSNDGNAWDLSSHAALAHGLGMETYVTPDASSPTRETSGLFGSFDELLYGVMEWCQYVAGPSDPAMFWVDNEDGLIVRPSAPRYGEIDAFESDAKFGSTDGRFDGANLNIHFDTSTQADPPVTYASPGSSQGSQWDQWVTFELVWLPDQVRLYEDGQQVALVTASSGATIPDVPMAIDFQAGVDNAVMAAKNRSSDYQFVAWVKTWQLDGFGGT